MKMREISRADDKKHSVKNSLDLIIGAGIANQSVSIDGVSQSIGTTQSAMYGGASARVNEYTNDLNDHLLPVLRQKFGGIRMIVV